MRISAVQAADASTGVTLGLTACQSPIISTPFRRRPSSSGQDTALSRREQGFDSPRARHLFPKYLPNPGVRALGSRHVSHWIPEMTRKAIGTFVGLPLTPAIATEEFVFVTGQVGSRTDGSYPADIAEQTRI